MSAVKNYLSLVTFSHTIFAMPFAMIGFFLGVMHLRDHSRSLDGTTGWSRDIANPGIWIPLLIKLVLVILCMVFARSAAMAFNRWLDQHFDARNPRTSVREIPSGVISANNALVFVVLSSAGFIATTWFINPICFYLSFVALFIILFYSYTKRFTALCHLVLGLGLSLAPIGAYLAVTGVFNLLPILFSLVVLCWVSGFDIIYALQDEDFDRSNQLYSVPTLLGRKNALLVSSGLHVLSACAVILAGIYGHSGIAYWAGVILFCGILVYQHSLIKLTDISKVNRAFMRANGMASVLFAVFVISDLFCKTTNPL